MKGKGARKAVSSQHRRGTKRKRDDNHRNTIDCPVIEEIATVATANNANMNSAIATAASRSNDEENDAGPSVPARVRAIAPSTAMLIRICRNRMRKRSRLDPTDEQFQFSNEATSIVTERLHGGGDARGDVGSAGSRGIDTTGRRPYVGGSRSNGSRGDSGNDNHLTNLDPHRMEETSNILRSHYYIFDRNFDSSISCCMNIAGAKVYVHKSFRGYGVRHFTHCNWVSFFRVILFDFLGYELVNLMSMLRSYRRYDNVVRYQHLSSSSQPSRSSVAEHNEELDDDASAGAELDERVSQIQHLIARSRDRPQCTKFYSSDSSVSTSSPPKLPSMVDLARRIQIRRDRLNGLIAYDNDTIPCTDVCRLDSMHGGSCFRMSPATTKDNWPFGVPFIVHQSWPSRLVQRIDRLRALMHDETPKTFAPKHQLLIPTMLFSSNRNRSNGDSCRVDEGVGMGRSRSDHGEEYDNGNDNDNDNDEAGDSTVLAGLRYLVQESMLYEEEQTCRVPLLQQQDLRNKLPVVITPRCMIPPDELRCIDNATLARFCRHVDRQFGNGVATLFSNPIKLVMLDLSVAVANFRLHQRPHIFHVDVMPTLNDFLVMLCITDYCRRLSGESMLYRRPRNTLHRQTCSTAKQSRISQP